MIRVTTLTWLAVVAVALAYNSPAASQGLNTARQPWTWGQRHQGFQPRTDQSISRSIQIRRQSNIPPFHFARVAETNEPRVHGATTFKSITARTIPSPQQTTAALLASGPDNQENSNKPPMKPSPIDTTPQGINPTLGSHFEVIERELSTPDQPQARAKPTIITPGEYPYPFDAKPVDLGDGTSIGGFIPDDTLPIDSHPVSNSHTKGPYKPSTVSEDHDTRYTTLDKLFSSRLPTELPDPQTLTNDILGGLHPNEVFYADKDLVIIKGGGFHPNNSQKPPGSDNLEQEAQKAVKPAPPGNELGEANDPRITNVRPDEKFSRVPLPFRFVNGNIPTIVSPPASSHQHAQNRQFRPVHDQSFRPLPRRRPAQYTSASSQHSLAYEEAPSNFQNLDEEEFMIAQPSVASDVKILPTQTKRSTDSNVVSYHYQTRGTGSNQHSIVDYTIQRQNGGSSGHQQRASNGHRTLANQNQNFIRTAPEKVASKTQQVQAHSNFAANRQPQIGGEDFSVPARGPVVNLVPSIQTPRREPSQRPGTRPVQPEISLEGDTRVNFLPPLPPVNPQAHVINTNNQPGPSFRPSTNPQTRPVAFITSQPAQLVNPGPHHTQFTNAIRENPVSLAGDTRVNYLPPLPPVNRQAEVLAHRPSVRVQPALTPNPQVTRLNPQITRLHPGHQSPQRPQTQRRIAQQPNGQKRFMEPRRRTRTRQRPTPTL